jgi:cell wall-associated NlpC family hydrolase
MKKAATASPLELDKPAAAMKADLDPRINAIREDLADESLKDIFEAPAYAKGVRRQINRAAVPLRLKPSASLGFETEALYGEIATQFDQANGWAWIQLERDRYVGYVPVDTLAPTPTEPTHRVKALGTFLYSGPDIKSPPVMHLSINARLTIAETGEKLSRTASGMFVVNRHIAENGRYARDFVEIAERFIGTPYLWGGRTRVGIDCSGLVQMSLVAAGRNAPRDSDMQMRDLGETVSVSEALDDLRRGDLVFWKGHVGIMLDGVMIVHASAHHMAVTVETLPEVVERNLKAGSAIVAVKRMDFAET